MFFAFLLDIRDSSAAQTKDEIKVKDVTKETTEVENKEEGSRPSTPVQVDTCVNEIKQIFF